VIVATDEDYGARLVNLFSAAREVLFRGEAIPVFKMQSSSDHRYLLTSGWYSAYLWDLTTGEPRVFPLTGSVSAATLRNLLQLQKANARRFAEQAETLSVRLASTATTV
jgi:hypothetical protein